MTDEVKTADDAQEKLVYELGFHVLPTFEDAKVLEFVDGVKKSITDQGGEIIASGDPELIDLAYTMTKMLNNKYERFDTAFFGWIKFDLDREQIGALKKTLDTNTDVLRFLIIKTDREVFVERPTLKEVKPTESKTIDAPKTKDESAGEVSETELSEKIEEMIS